MEGNSGERHTRPAWQRASATHNAHIATTLETLDGAIAAELGIDTTLETLNGAIDAELRELHAAGLRILTPRQQGGITRDVCQPFLYRADASLCGCQSS